MRDRIFHPAPVGGATGASASGPGRPRRQARPLAVAGGVLAAAAAMVVAAPPATLARTTAGGTEIAVTPGAYGPMLVVASGHFRGYSAYIFTGDRPPRFGCGTQVTSVLGHRGSCTGPETDRSAEWPAVTTSGPPVAGPGVAARMLGSVVRPGIGRQVTYGGHPLYQFDQGPGEVTGELFDEPSLPPWHGVWYVVSPDGAPLASSATLTTETVGHGKIVVGAIMNTAIGAEVFPLYTYGADSRGHSACAGACSRSWPPLLTGGTPGLIGPLRSGRVGSIRRRDGSRQVTYDGRPLYLYANEGIAPSGTGYAATGSGNGVSFGGASFHLATP